MGVYPLSTSSTLWISEECDRKMWKDRPYSSDFWGDNDDDNDDDDGVLRQSDSDADGRKSVGCCGWDKSI